MTRSQIGGMFFHPKGKFEWVPVLALRVPSEVFNLGPRIRETGCSLLLTLQPPLKT